MASKRVRSEDYQVNTTEVKKIRNNTYLVSAAVSEGCATCAGLEISGKTKK